nr:PREDICTED: LOW QUALITY PROTEIN: uncharacterized protein LOC105669151 [Linepithema humile]
MMKRKGIVLQRAIPGKSRLCDIDEDDEICTDSDVTVLLVDLNPTSQPVAIAITSSTIMDCAQNIEAGDIMEINIPILFEKKADADNLALNKTDIQVLSEFCTIKKWKEEERAIETFITKVDTMIKALEQHFGIEPNELGYVFHARFNDRGRQFTSTSYVYNGESYCTAYVVADEFRMKIVEPSVCKSIACLLASYYIWDTNYPKAYKNAMEYIDHEVLGTVMKENPTIDKFIRDRDRTRLHE